MSKKPPHQSLQRYTDNLILFTSRHVKLYAVPESYLDRLCILGLATPWSDVRGDDFTKDTCKTCHEGQEKMSLLSKMQRLHKLSFWISRQLDTGGWTQGQKTCCYYQNRMNVASLLEILPPV